MENKRIFKEQKNIFIIDDIETLKQMMEKKIEEITGEKIDVTVDYFEDGYPDFCLFLEYEEQSEDESKRKIEEELNVNPGEISLLGNALLSEMIGKEVAMARVYFDSLNQMYVRVQVS